MNKQGQFVTCNEATPAKRQHKKVCRDCPFSRKALKGWLGSLTPQEWVQLAHGEGTSECHVHTGVSCAGLAIYRANVCKSVRDPSALSLPPDRKAVFSMPSEFLEHHQLPIDEENDDES